MSNQFLKLRRSAVPGKIPDTGSLALGEIALNTYDGVAFMKKDGLNGEEIVVIGNSSGSFSGSFSGEFTGSLFGTSSWAYNASTASTADDFFVRGDITGSNALFTGTVTAQTLVVQTITSSVIYSSGSNVFGNKLTDTQQFTGSVTITGSLALNGDPVVTQTPYNTFSSSIQSRTTRLENTASVLTTASASFALVSASYSAFSQSFNTGSFTGSFRGQASLTGSFSGSFSGNVDNIDGITNFIAKFDSPNSVDSSVIYQSASHIAINEISFTADNPEALYVFQTHPTSINVLTGKGNLNSYLQNNIQNTNQGVNASSDVVATANNGNETSNYVDMGINSENYNQNFIGGPNDAYLYSIANNLHIGSAATGSQHVALFVGGDNVDANTKLQLNPNNRHFMSGSLALTGSLNVKEGITGSLFGTSSWAVSASRALSGNGGFSGSFTGSFFGNGGGLTNISASSVVGLNLSLIGSGSVTASTDPAYGFRVNSNTQISGSTRITGSLGVTGSFSLSGSVGSLFSANVDTMVFTGSLFQSGSIQLTGSLNVTSGGITGSLFGTSSYAVSASYALSSSLAANSILFNGTSSGVFATTGSNTFIGTQTITGSNGRLIYTGTTPGAYPTLAEIHANNDYPWLERFYNDTFSTSSAIMAYFSHNDGRFVFHNESTESIGLQVNGFNAENGLLVYSDKVAFVNNVEVTGSLNVVGGITGSLYGTASWALNSLTSSFVLNAVSASFAATASSADNFLIRQDATASNLLVTNTITAQTLIVQTITSSVDFVTGSTKFGTQLTDTHQFTGSVTVTGSLSLNNSPVVTDSTLTPFSSSVSTRLVTLENASASFASDSGSNSTRVTNLESTASVLTTASQSFAIVSSSYSAASQSLSTRTTDLEFTASVLTSASASFATVSSSYASASGSLSSRVTDLETTASILTTASASFALVSSSYADASGSLSTRVTDLESTASVLTSASASFAQQSGSNSVRLTNLESTASVLTTASASFASVSSSYASASGSLSTRTTNLESTASVLTTASASFALVSSSYSAFSQSYNTGSFTGSFTGNLTGTSSFTISSSLAANSILLNGTGSSVFATTGSNIFVGNQTVTGSLFTSGSNTLVGSTTLTGSLSITGSTVQTGNNTLIGNTSLSGSLTVSGSQGASTPTINIYGDIEQTGYIRFLPVTTNINTSISASYIFVSGSTQDLYFSQNGKGYSNVTRLRWLEGNLYTGLLNGGLITSQSSTTYQVGSGSGIIVNLNASLNDNPYPTTTYVNWPNLTGNITQFSASYDQTFVAISSAGTLISQSTAFLNGQVDTQIPVGYVAHQNNSTINGTVTEPSLAYGWKQRSNVFISAFGPLKLSGFNLAVSGSSTGSLIVGSGTAFLDGGNYQTDPNNPAYVTATGTSTSRIFRYYESGSDWVYNTNGGVGFGAIDPARYSNNGTLSSVGAGNWSIQRVFFFPTSPLSPKPIVVYYGNAVYATEADAIANIPIEPFTEAPSTAATAIYLGAIVISGNGVFTNTSTFTIYPGGLFRQVGGSGGGGSLVTQTLAGLSDVLISGPTNGQPLVYNNISGKWQNSSTLTATLTGNADTATSASHALTSSYAISSSQAATASYVLQAVSSSFATTASFVENAQTASYVLQAVSASFATTSSNAITSSYSLTATSSSYATTSSHTIQADTASYVLQAVSSSFAISSSNAITASFAINSTSSSYAISSSEAISSSYAISSSEALQAISASFASQAATASYIVNAISASYASTASSADNFLIRQDATASNLLVTNTITAQTLVVQTITSSVDFVTGSTKFGTELTNTHQFTGSVTITGSLSLNNSPVITDSIFTPFSSSIELRTTNLEATASTLIAASASFAQDSGSNSVRLINLESTASVLTTASASFAAVSQSYSNTSGSLSIRVTDLESTASVLTTASASFAIVSSSYASASGSLSTRVTNLENASASFASDSGSNSIRLTNLESTASVLTTASASFSLVSSSYSAFSQSYNTGSFTGSFTGFLYGTASWAISASQAINAQTASLAISASYFSGSITSAITADTASFVTSSNVYGPFGSDSILSASYALTASYALNAGAGAGFPFSGSAVITGSLLVSQSFVDFTQASYVIGAFTGSLFGTASWANNALTSSNVQGGLATYVPLWNTNTSLTSSYLNQASDTLKTIYNGTDRGLNLNYAVDSYILGNAGAGNNTYLQVFDGGSVINVYTPNYTYFNDKVGVRIIPTNPGLAISGSLEVTGPGTTRITNADVIITGSLNSTGSVFLPGLTSSSFANVVSYDTTTGQLYYQATGSGGGDSVTASYALTASAATDFTVRNTLTLDRSLMDYATVASSIVGSNNLFTQSTGSYTSAFFTYTVSNGTNARSGQVMSVWNAASAQFTDNSTLDIGSTTAVTCSVSIVGTDVQFNVQTNTSGWRIKSVATYM